MDTSQVMYGVWLPSEMIDVDVATMLIKNEDWEWAWESGCFMDFNVPLKRVLYMGESK